MVGVVRSGFVGAALKRDVVGRAITSSDVLIGAALVPSGEEVELVVVDCDGVLVSIGRGGSRSCVRMALDRGLRVFPSLGLLLRALAEGEVIGVLSRDGRRLGVPFGFAASTPVGVAGFLAEPANAPAPV